jgi:hypothetical protein
MKSGRQGRHPIEFLLARPDATRGSCVTLALEAYQEFASLMFPRDIGLDP